MEKVLVAVVECFECDHYPARILFSQSVENIEVQADFKWDICPKVDLSIQNFIFPTGEDGYEIRLKIESNFVGSFCVRDSIFLTNEIYWGFDILRKIKPDLYWAWLK